MNPVQGREQAGQRPVLVLSVDSINRLPLVVTVVVGTKGENVTRDEPFAKTHNLRALVIQAATLDKGLDALAKPEEILTPYVSAFRYPGGDVLSKPLAMRTGFGFAGSAKHEALLRDAFPSQPANVKQVNSQNRVLLYPSGSI